MQSIWSLDTLVDVHVDSRMTHGARAVHAPAQGIALAGPPGAPPVGAVEAT